MNNASDSGTTNYVYALGTKTSVTSAILDGTNWKAVSAALKDAEDGTKTSNFGAVTVDLATLDKRITADTKTDGAAAVANYTYDFVIDQYVDTNTKAKAALTATVANDTYLQDLQTVVGQVAAGTSTYNAADAGTDQNNVAQTIKAAKDWNVTGSAGDDIITGASANSKGVTTTLTGGLGDDTITGGATENFTVGQGADVLKSYATGKDKVIFDADGNGEGDDGFLVKLNGTALDTTGKKLSGVLLYADDANSVLLTGMGNGKAVNINGSNYYFGDGTKTKGRATFTFEEGSYFYGNGALTNTLKGGSYLSTLVGGAASDSMVGGNGVDTFWFEEYEGDDTVQNFANGKDKLYLAKGADNFKVSGSDVVFSDSTGDNSVTLQKMANSKAVAISTDGENYTNYFFGKNGANNTMTGKADNKDVFIAAFDTTKTNKVTNLGAEDEIRLTGINTSQTGIGNMSISDFIKNLGLNVDVTTNRNGITTTNLNYGKKTVLSASGNVSFSDTVNVSSDGVATITTKS